MEMELFSNTIAEIVAQKQPFKLRFYVLNEDIERRVEEAVDYIFSYYGHGEMMGVIYTCVKELMINATKANLKRVLFQENQLDIDDENSYVQGMISFRNFLNEASYSEHLSALKNQGYWVEIRFEYDEKGVKIEVFNHARITTLENKRLREKLKKAMQYDDIATYYIEQGDELEGAGMGIALIVMLLKGLGMDPAYFRIGNVADDTTVARIEIPFTAEFHSVREKQGDGHEDSSHK